MSQSPRQFDGVSVVKQNKKECIILLRLTAMKTTRAGFPPKHKPTNTEFPPAEVSDEFMTVTALVKEEEGSTPTTYQWVKRHQDKVVSCKTKVTDKETVEVSLAKKDAKDWLRPFLEYLLEL